MKGFTVNASIHHIPQCIDFIENELSRLKISKKEKIQSVLSSEEAMACLIKHADENAMLSVTVNRFMGSTVITVQCRGSETDASEIFESWYDRENLDPEEIIVIDRLIEKTGSSRIRYKRAKTLNIFSIKVEVSRLQSLYLTLFALAFGILCGLILKQVPSGAAQALSDHLFTPVYTVFMNALKLIIGPLVFFSISESIVGFSDIRSLGRIAAKVFFLYIATSLLSIGVGFAVGHLFPIGEPALQSLITDADAAAISKGSEASVSIKDMLVGIVPSDIVSPFLKLDMLQIIFIAVMLGISTALMDQKGAFAQFIISANRVFSKFTAIIISGMPIAVFCSMAKMIVGMNFGDWLSVMMWVPCCYAGHLAMMIVYGLLLFLLAKYNPFQFFRRFMPAILTGFSTGSSNATLPVSIKQCAEALKISPRIYTFSLPMGATINMDGSCITLVITALFGARIFGIDMTSSMIVSLIIAILSLSLGSPGVPGGNLVCAAILLPIIGVPAETISLIMGLYSLVGMSQCATNITGDAVVTTIVAKSENMIDAS